MIAQINIATLKAPIDAPEIADFKNNLDRINQLAEQSDGFIWRLQDDSGNATAIQMTDNPLLVLNLSVWLRFRDLHHYVFQTAHKSIMMRRDEFFETDERPSLALWYLPDNAAMPSVEDAFDRLEHLRNFGPSETAFGWADHKKFSPKDYAGK